MRNLTFEGYHLPTVARIARDLGSPTGDRFAEFLWRLHNSPALPVEVAQEFMREAGYEPFKGFPLLKKGAKR